MEFASVKVSGGRLEMEPDATLKVAQTLELSGGGSITADWNQTGGRIEAQQFDRRRWIPDLSRWIRLHQRQWAWRVSLQHPWRRTWWPRRWRQRRGRLRRFPRAHRPPVPLPAGSLRPPRGVGSSGSRSVETLTSTALITANGTASGNQSFRRNRRFHLGRPCHLDRFGYLPSRCLAAGGVTSGNLDSSGGRVAVYYADADEFSGFCASSASAGGVDAVDGTIVFVDTSGPDPRLFVFQRMTLPGRFESRFRGHTIC